MHSFPSTMHPALLVIDVQRGFDVADFWGERDNPECERNIESLIAHWREQGWPVVYVRHDSTNPASPSHPSSQGNSFKSFVTGDPDLLVHKSVNSAFFGTPDLDAWLRQAHISEVVCGITTNFCCETTARMAGNLGYTTLFAIDATHTFGRTRRDGQFVPASVLSMITETNLDGEFATVVRTQELLHADAAPVASIAAR